MNKIKVITDSCLDMPKEVMAEYDLEIMPIMINFGEESFKDGIDINVTQLLEKMKETNIFPTTAQITPAVYEEKFKNYLDEGYKVIVLPLSSGMSGTYQSACLAKNMLETDDIVIIDTKQVTSGLGLLVLKACQLAKEGIDLCEIENQLNEMVPRVKSIICFESLENLVRGGRLSKTAGAIGTALGLRLILEVNPEGVMAVKEKVRGNKKALKIMTNHLDNANIDPSMPTMLIEYENQEMYNPIKEYLVNRGVEHIDTTVGCAVGIHAGPRVVAVFYVEK